MKNTILLGLIAAIAAVGFILLPAKAPAPQLGSSTGPVDSASYHCWAGVCHYFGSATLKTATTTPCAIQSPAATSTLGAVALRLDTSSSTATIWDIAKAANAFATTTALGTAYSVGASAQAFVQASTAPAAGAATVLAPNSWVVFGARAGITAGDAAGTGFVPAGACSATFVTTLP